MSSRRLSESPSRLRSGRERLVPAPIPPGAHRGRLRRGVLGTVGLLGAAALLAACGDPWTAPESTIRSPTTTTPALTPVPGGGGSLTITDPQAFQVESPGRAVPAQNNTANSGQGPHQANHNYY